MRRRKVIIGILALVLCGVLAVVFWPEAERPEPIYNGRKLSQWAQSFGTNGAQREAAIRAIGTNGISFYLEWVSYKPSLLKRARIEIAARTRSWLPFEWS